MMKNMFGLLFFVLGCGLLIAGGLSGNEAELSASVTFLVGSIILFMCGDGE